MATRRPQVDYESKGLTAEQTAINEEEKTDLYVLSFKYTGGADKYEQLKNKLKDLGWYRIEDMISTYVKRVREGEGVQQTEVIQVLSQHKKDDEDAEVRFAICKYIPPNQRPDEVEGIANLFDEEQIEHEL